MHWLFENSAGSLRCRGWRPRWPLEPNYGFAKSIFSRGAMPEHCSAPSSYRFCCAVAAIGCNGAYPQTSVWGPLAAHCRTSFKEETCEMTREGARNSLAGSERVSSRWLHWHRKIGPHEHGAVLRTALRGKDPIWQRQGQLKGPAGAQPRHRHEPTKNQSCTT
jgi:hypothetical protein